MIIDDPVSNMDFNYVYNVTQAIRNIKKEFNLSKVRYIILTHNMEFMNLLVRNKIVKQKYLFCDGHFADFKDDYIMPYTSNLLDIYKTANNTKKPTYIIPNQIRYVLETIQRFEDASSNIADYISDSEILKKEVGLYSLIQDCSHDGIQNSRGYTDKMIIDSCKAVIEFINKKYPGQIEKMKILDTR